MNKIFVVLALLLASALACSAPSGSASAPTSAPTVEVTTAAPETPAGPASRHVLIQSSDFSLATFDVNGQSMPFGKASLMLSPGQYNQFGVSNGTLYALSGYDAGQPKAYAIDSQGTQPLAAVQADPQGLAFWPGDGTSPGRFAWGEADYSQATLPSRLMVANVGADSGTVAFTKTADQQLYATPFRWSVDGSHLLYSMEPTGLGGYILFGGRSSLYLLDPATLQSTPLVEADTEHNIICLDDLSPDQTLMSEHCDAQISVLNLQTQQKTVINPPDGVPAADIGQRGDIRFSPDGSRVAFGLALGNPENERGWVAVTDDLSGSSRLVATSPAGSFYSVLGWIDNDHLLLATPSISNPSVSNILILTLDGSAPHQIAPNSLFIAFTP